jgi:hypothetical protein
MAFGLQDGTRSRYHPQNEQRKASVTRSPSTKDMDHIWIERTLFGVGNSQPFDTIVDWIDEDHKDTSLVSITFQVDNGILPMVVNRRLDQCRFAQMLVQHP